MFKNAEEAKIRSYAAIHDELVEVNNAILARADSGKTSCTITASEGSLLHTNYSTVERFLKEHGYRVIQNSLNRGMEIQFEIGW